MSTEVDNFFDEGQGVPVPQISAVEPTKAPAPAKKKVFTLNDLVRSVKVELTLPALYPDFEPWRFNMRLKFSEEAEEKRQVYLALTPTEQTVKLDEQNLDELCDLLIETPQGFGDIADTGGTPGDNFRAYVTSADPTGKEMLYNIIRGAITLYWRKISPQEFRSKV